MIAKLELNTQGPDTQLVVETRPHPTAGNLQLTRILIRDAQHPSQSFSLDRDQVNTLAVFLLSIPDDQP